MKKFYIVVASAMIIAGTAAAQVRLGAEIGLNVNNLANKYTGVTTSNQLKVGFHGGLVADIALSDHFSVSPGLRYSMKGGQVESNYNTINSAGLPASRQDKNKLTYHYLELPVNLIYHTGTPGTNRFMVGVGPYIAYMVNAQNKYTTQVTGDPEIKGAQKLNIGNDSTDYIKGLDYGAQAFVGYEFANSLFLKAGAQAGLANTLPKGNNTFYSKNYNFFFTVGYMFLKK